MRCQFAFIACGLLLALPARAELWPSLADPPVTGGGENDGAIIVAIEKYLDFNPIPGAAQNAQDWFDYLVDGRGIPAERAQLLIGGNAQPKNVLRAVAEVRDTLPPGGTLWFVFIGHGMARNDDGLLIGPTATANVGNLEDHTIARSRLLQELYREDTQSVVVLDTCFSGRDTSGGVLVKGLQPAALNIDVVQTDAVILSAAAADQYAGGLLGEDRPAFSYLLLGALHGWGDLDKDGTVTATEAHQYVRRALQTTLRDRRQTPQLSGPPDTRLARSGASAGPAFGKLVVAASRQTTATPAPSPTEARPHTRRIEAPNVQVDSGLWSAVAVGAMGLGTLALLAGGASHGLAELTKGSAPRDDRTGLVLMTVSEAESLQTLRTMTWVGLGAGAVFVVGGGALWLFAGEDE
jgi:hypothetical protein